MRKNGEGCSATSQCYGCARCYDEAGLHEGVELKTLSVTYRCAVVHVVDFFPAEKFFGNTGKSFTSAANGIRLSGAAIAS